MQQKNKNRKITMDLYRILSNQKEEIESLDTSDLITREEEKEVNLKSKLAQVVIGVRRSGKSTLCQKVLLESGVNFAYVNFDDEKLSDLQKEELDDVMENLYRIYGDFTHLLLDEIQNIKGWEFFVNRLLRQGVKLVVTGSNANLLSSELTTHLTGRYNQITLYPFSFSEYCLVNKTDVKSQSTKAIALRLRCLDKYLMNGGFPETIFEPDSRKYAKNLIDAIVNKDICKRYNVKYGATLMQMANGLLDRYCQEVTYSSLTEMFDIKSVHTTKSYMTYLCNAFLLCNIPKFSFKSIERQSFRKCYAIDNSFIAGHNDTISTESYGWRLENAVAIELCRRASKKLMNVYYIKVNKEYEIDFAVVDRGHIIELVQVTYNFDNPSTKQYNREILGLIKAAKKFDCNNLTLVYMGSTNKEITIDGFTVHQTSAIDWFLRK